MEAIVPRPLEIALAIELALVLAACIPCCAKRLPLFGSHAAQVALLIGGAVLWMKVAYLFS